MLPHAFKLSDLGEQGEAPTERTVGRQLPQPFSPRHREGRPREPPCSAPSAPAEPPHACSQRLSRCELTSEKERGSWNEHTGVSGTPCPCDLKLLDAQAEFTFWEAHARFSSLPPHNQPGGLGPPWELGPQKFQPRDKCQQHRGQLLSNKLSALLFHSSRETDPSPTGQKRKVCVPRTDQALP